MPATNGCTLTRYRDIRAYAVASAKAWRARHDGASCPSRPVAAAKIQLSTMTLQCEFNRSASCSAEGILRGTYLNTR